MNDFPGKEHLISLVQEGLQHDAELGKPYANSFAPDLTFIQDALKTPVSSEAQAALIYSAVLRRITGIEKRTITLMIGASPVTSYQRDHLVRILSICSDLTKIISVIQERGRRSPSKPG